MTGPSHAARRFAWRCRRQHREHTEDSASGFPWSLSGSFGRLSVVFRLSVSTLDTSARALLQRNQPRLERVVADGAAVFGFDFEMFFLLEDLDPLHLLAEGFQEA